MNNKKIQINIDNFTEKELACKCCGKFSMTTRHLVNIQALRYKFNKSLIVTSGCRCRKHNKDEGGVDKIQNGILITSRHECDTKQADATDLKPLDLKDLEKLYNLIIKMDLFTEVIWYKKSGFIHIATYPEKKVKYFDIINK